MDWNRMKWERKGIKQNRETESRNQSIRAVCFCLIFMGKFVNQEINQITN